MAEIRFNINDGNLGRTSDDGDEISGIFYIEPNVLPSGVSSNTLYELNSVEDAELLGIDSTYDTVQFSISKGKPYYEVREYFRFNPKGRLFVWFTEDDITYQEAFSNPAYIKAMLKEAKGNIKQLAITCMDADVVIGIGLKQTVLNAIPAANVLAKEEFEAHRPIFFILPGFSFNGTVTSVPDLSVFEAPNVAVCIGQDPKRVFQYANTSFVNFDYKQPCTSTCLARIAQCSVYENIAWVNEGNLTGYDKDYQDYIMSEAYLSSGAKADTIEDDYKKLSAKGYVFTREYIVSDTSNSTLLSGTGKVYFFDDRVANATSSDFNSIRNIRTVNKAVRKAYAALLPYQNSPVYVDPTTGKISLVDITEFENVVAGKLTAMKTAGEISGSRVSIDPNQNILANNTIIIQIWIVPVGCAKEIEVNISLVPSLQNQ